MRRAVEELVPERDYDAHIERKVWEFAMLMLFLRDTGALREDARLLSVGAGNERILFWLADRVGRIVATDIYGEGRFAGAEADASMLADPRAHAPWPYREDRLEVRWMDGRRLDFPDASFDAAFSVSSIEHFGSPADIASAARELGRVVKPGGHAFVVTECFVRRHPVDSAPVDLVVRAASLGRRRRPASPRRRGGALDDVFTPRELQARIVKPSGLELMQPLDLSLSPQSWENVVEARPDGSLVSQTGSCYPQLLVRTRRSVFTSVCLPLRKTAG